MIALLLSEEQHTEMYCTRGRSSSSVLIRSSLELNGVLLMYSIWNAHLRLLNFKFSHGTPLCTSVDLKGLARLGGIFTILLTPIQ